ncbi:hypothetical protein [Microbacterium sp.]|uniref:hypothetical protein n=1 Tax=Microbacterium sp. TaxID=51671 RepID=UPI002811E12C|nr:hypothetical protein [Microbacterium sp.]
MENDIDDTADRAPHDDTIGSNGGRRLRFWLRAAEGLIARERAYGGRGVRHRIEAAIPAEDLEVTVRTLEAIARELGDEHEVHAFGSRARGPRHPRHGLGHRVGGRSLGRHDLEGEELDDRGFPSLGFGRRGHGRGGFRPAHPHRRAHHHADHHGFGPEGSDRRGRHHAC